MTPKPKSSARPAIYLVGGPSGAGKDTLLLGARAACQAEPVTFIIRHVTRPAALCTELETSVDDAAFSAAAAAGEHALSWSAHESVRYAIPKAALEAALSASPPQRIVLNVSRSILDEVLRDYGSRADVYVLLMSASAEALRARLRARGREDDKAIEARVAKATAYEAPHAARGHRVLRVLNDTSVEAGVAKVIAALLTPTHVPVVGLVGCSAAGKSTLCDAVAHTLRQRSPPLSLRAAAVTMAAAAATAVAVVASRRGGALAAATAAAAAAVAASAVAARLGRCFTRLKVVTCDDHYLPLERCPRFGLAREIRWPGGGGAVPEAFAARGDADLNHPASVDWGAVARAVDAAVDEAAAADAADGGATLVVLEGLLLLGEGAEVARRRVAQWVVLDDNPGDAAAQEVLWRRKWQRSGHLGKKSYRERGVSAEAYAAYWRDYVAARWHEHGLARVAALGAECGGAPAVARLECVGPGPEVLAASMLRVVEAGGS